MIQWLHRYVFRGTRLLFWGWIVMGAYLVLRTSPWWPRESHAPAQKSPAPQSAPRSAPRQ